jgi:hypothetical protein
MRVIQREGANQTFPLDPCASFTWGSTMDFTINIQTNADTASLMVNGDEQGGKVDGIYSIKRVARAGQTSTFIITAKDVFGNTDTKTLSVSRAIADSSKKYATLNPAAIKNRTSPDAV